MSHSSSGSRANVDSGSVLGLVTPGSSDSIAPTVLGATTPLVAGASILPVTGNNPLVLALVITSMTIAALVLISFVVSRIVRKFI